MELFLAIPNRINFLQMGRFGRSSEQRFRMNFRKKFGWISFNRTLVQEGNPNRRAIAIDPSYISKSGKKTPGAGYFWSGCASAVKWSLELMGFALVDGNPVHLLRHSRGKRCAASGHYRAESTACGLLKRKHAHGIVLSQGNYAPVIKNGQKIRPKRPE